MPYVPKRASEMLYKHNKFMYDKVFSALTSVSGSVEIDLVHIASKSFFRGTVFLGNPSKELHVDFDTGSPIFWTQTLGACNI